MKNQSSWEFNTPQEQEEMARVLAQLISRQVQILYYDEETERMISLKGKILSNYSCSVLFYPKEAGYGLMIDHYNLRGIKLVTWRRREK